MPATTILHLSPEEAKQFLRDNYKRLTVEQIAQELGCSPNSIYQRYTKMFKGPGGQELKELLERNRAVNFDAVNQSNSVKAHSGNGWRFLSEGEQMQIVADAQETSATGAANKHGISVKRLKLILDKFGVVVPNRVEQAAENRLKRELNPAGLQTLKKMMGKRYLYFAKKRTIKGYEVVDGNEGKEVHIRTLIECARHEDNYERVVKLPLRGIAGVLRDYFIPA